jgi:hypothetical protein
MWKRATHLAIGIGLLAISGYFLLGVAFGWKVFWRQELWRTAHPAKPAKSVADDPLFGLTDGTVYGVLNSEDGTQADDEAVPPQTSAPPIEHVAPTVIAPNHFLHKRLLVTAYKGVEFVVPALALHPQLQGRFRSVATNHTSDGSAVELLLMTDREFATFVRNETQTTESSAFPSNHGAIDWKLGATYGKPQKYYLVFLNAFEGQGPVTVDADFTVSFD